ncbi:MAG: LOG family protein [Anaerolineales bacterium]
MTAKAQTMVVSVFGAAFLPENGPAYQTARELGERIARQGWAVATGGYGGTMEAVSRGAAEAGGHTIGVTCETLSRAGRLTNAWVREEIHCETIRERLVTLVRRADAAIALDGGIGTLAEITFCWVQIQTGELPPRPLIVIGPVWKETLDAFFRSADGYVKDSDKAIIRFAASPLEAVRMIQRNLSPAPPLFGRDTKGRGS